MTFETGVGDVADIYLLYINQKTHLVDQFLFTVMDFGLKDPYLMTVEYEEIDGLVLPTRRRYVEANWDGEPKSEQWSGEEISVNVRFNNGFKKRHFAKPSR